MLDFWLYITSKCYISEMKVNITLCDSVFSVTSLKFSPLPNSYLLGACVRHYTTEFHPVLFQFKRRFL
jgi:hypothetical protein